MRAGKLSKLYILKIIILRLVCIELVNFSYLYFNHLIPKKLTIIALRSIEALNIVAIFIVFLLPIIEYFAYRYEITDDYIEINYGIIFRNYVYIPMENIKYAIITRDPIDYLLGLSKINIYTPARKRAIRCLTYKKAKEVCRAIRIKSMVVEK